MVTFSPNLAFVINSIILMDLREEQDTIPNQVVIRIYITQFIA